MITGIAIILLFISLFGLLLQPTLQSQIANFSDKLPEYYDQIKQWSQAMLDKFYTVTGDGEGAANAGEAVNDIAIDSLPVGGDAAVKTVDAVKASAAALLRTLTNVFLVPVIAFYLLRDWNKIITDLKKLIPNQYRKRVYKLGGEMDAVLKSFLYGQFLVMCALGAMYSAGLLFIGLEFSLLIGVLAGVLSFVPFLGTAVGMIVASLVMFMQTGEFIDVWKVLVVFSIGQFIEGNLLTPKLVGDKVNLHPVMVIFAVLVGGEVFGFTGVLLALPVAAVIWVTIKHFVADPLW